ncbi:MAG: class I SAM-dependent methyltransferase [Chloroflexota bacterium]
MNHFDLGAREWDNDPKRILRANTVAQAIVAAVPLNRQMAALEYGCGTGLLSFALQPHLGPITLADSSAGMLEVLSEKIAAAGITNMAPLWLDLATQTLPGEHFDIIYTLMALHHIPDTTAILGSFHTLLNPGGHLCIADLDQEDGSFHTHESGFDGHHGFERTALTRQLSQAGFDHIRFTTCFEMTKNGRVYPIFLATAKSVKRDA